MYYLHSKTSSSMGGVTVNGKFRPDNTVRPMPTSRNWVFLMVENFGLAMRLMWIDRPLIGTVHGTMEDKPGPGKVMDAWNWDRWKRMRDAPRTIGYFASTRRDFEELRIFNRQEMAKQHSEEYMIRCMRAGRKQQMEDWEKEQKLQSKQSDKEQHNTTPAQGEYTDHHLWWGPPRKVIKLPAEGTIRSNSLRATVADSGVPGNQGTGDRWGLDPVPAKGLGTGFQVMYRVCLQWINRLLGIPPDRSRPVFDLGKIDQRIKELKKKEDPEFRSIEWLIANQERLWSVAPIYPQLYEEDVEGICFVTRVSFVHEQQSYERLCVETFMPGRTEARTREIRKIGEEILRSNAIRTLNSAIPTQWDRKVQSTQ